MRKIVAEIPFEVEDEIIVDALRDVIEAGKDLTHPDDIKDYKRLTKAAKRLLPYFGGDLPK